MLTLTRRCRRKSSPNSQSSGRPIVTPRRISGALDLNRRRSHTYCRCSVARFLCGPCTLVEIHMTSSEVSPYTSGTTEQRYADGNFYSFESFYRVEDQRCCAHRISKLSLPGESKK